MRKIILVAVLLLIGLSFLGTAYAAACSTTASPDWDVGQPQSSSQTVDYGQPTDISISITNNEKSATLNCYVSGIYQDIEKGMTKTFTIIDTAPAQQVPTQQTKSVSLDIACQGSYFSWSDLCTQQIYGSVTKTATYTYPLFSTIQAQQEKEQKEKQEQQAKSQADSAKTAATNAINGANSAINAAEKKINEASKLEAEVSSATQYINSAQSDYSSANALISSGNSAYSSKDYQSATSYYNQAQAKASSAQSAAATAKSQVDKILEEFNKIQTEAQNKVSDANSAIDTAKQRIGAGDKVIADATIIGLDTAQSKADIATARSKIDTAEDYYKEASNLFSAKNFEGAKGKAQSAINLADEAESLATGAYNSLNERLAVAGESSKAILNANSEVSQMNEILTKMDYILISVEKWGVDLSETKSVVTTAKANTDSAEDLLSQAKNRQASGSFDTAVFSANQARDNAATSRNRLDTMAQTISLSTQKALEKAYADTQTKIAEAEAETNSAGGTYGATPDLVVAAQNDLSEAKKSLEQARKEIENVKTVSDLKPLLEKAEVAFKALEATQQKITSATNNAKNAKLGLTKKIAIGAAAAAAAAGGGFLYYRSRKRKKKTQQAEQHKAEHKEEKTKEKKKEEPPSCHKCKTPIAAGQKFCSKCGAKQKEEKKKQQKVVQLKNCPDCKVKLKKNQKFCDSCGKKLTNGGKK